MLALILAQSRAQGVFVEQKIDSIGIFIGQQAHVTVTVTADENAQVVFPDWKPRTFLVPGVELLAVEIDSAKADNGQKSRLRRLTITSFDENLYALPPVEVKVDGKPYKSEQLALKVVTMDVDTLHPNEFFPPKDVQEFATLLDEHLQTLNSDYEAKRYKDITLQPLEIVTARRGLFNDWLKQHGKLGGQHKVPRLSNSREHIEELLKIN